MPDWLHAPDYTLARLLLQRGLGFVYVVAFLVVLEQFRPLLGERGLLPVPRFLAHASFREAPSLFHFRYSDRLLTAVSLLGLVLSLAIVIGLPDRWPAPLTIAVWLLLWALYLSIVNVGQVFYGFGWETLLLEAGFLAAFLGPASTPVPALLVWLFRWLLFRLEFGAGLIKMRNRERDGLPGNKFSPTDEQIGKEAADVLTYLDLFCEAHGIDLGCAAAQKFNEVSERVGFPDRIELT